jgi:diguanylate cyclase (GGDEF)-like protein
MTAVFQDALEILGTLEVEDVADRLLTLFAHATRAAGVSLWLVRDGEVLLHGEWGDLGAHPLSFPLLAGVETLGIVHVEPREGRSLSPEQRADAVALAQAGSIALQNASRFEELQQRTIRDDAFGTYRVAYLDDLVRKELDRSRRYGRCFSVALVSVDDVETLVREVGREATRVVDRAVIAAVSSVFRDADVLARASDGAYRVLLPETDRFGALAFIRRAGNELHRAPGLRSAGDRSRTAVNLGAATFPADGEDVTALFEACRERQERYRTSLLHRVRPRLDEMGFWDLAGALLADPVASGAATSARVRAPDELVEAIQREVAREVGRDVHARGALYVCASDPSAIAPLLGALPAIDGSPSGAAPTLRVHAIAPRAVLEAAEAAFPSHPLVEWIGVEADDALEECSFLLYLSDRGAYGALRSSQGELFHTSDAPLVDVLVAKLLEHYDLRGPEGT